jgi:hypothetical protein
MTHSPDHDPLIEHRRCWTCYQALSSTFAALAPDLKGMEPTQIVRALRRALLEAA